MRLIEAVVGGMVDGVSLDLLTGFDNVRASELGMLRAASSLWLPEGTFGQILSTLNIQADVVLPA